MRDTYFPEVLPAELRPAGRRLHVGAEVADDGEVDFRVWAAQAKSVAVVLEEQGRSVSLDRSDDGYFGGRTHALAGERYWFQIDEASEQYPDPASRYQPDGPHGPSEIVDPLIFKWTDDAWPGVKLDGQVIYELHVGTFTQ